MTDPTGRSFLSYRRTRAGEAGLLIAAQHDRGIPTWQDVSDLGEGPTEAQIREILADSETANGILWLTLDVADSAFIRNVEAPSLVRRVRANNGFYVLPVAAGGLDFAGAGLALDGAIGADDLRNWNISRVTEDPLGSDTASKIAIRLLDRRLSAIHRALAEDEPLKLGIYTVVRPPVFTGVSLTVDWTHRFEGRVARPEAWNDFLLPSLRDMAEGMFRKAPGRRVLASGNAAIPAVMALGAALPSTLGIHVTWRQFRPGYDLQDWSLASGRVSSGFCAELRPMDSSATDLAVLISVVDDIEPAFATSKSGLPGFRALIDVRKPDEGRAWIESSGQAVDIAHVVVDGIRRARREFSGALGTIHVFAAVPAGLAMLIGQLLNTLGPIQTYEYLSPDARGRYEPACLLKPSG